MRSTSAHLSAADSGDVPTLGQRMVHLVVTQDPHDHDDWDEPAHLPKGFIGQRTVGDVLSVWNFLDWAAHRVDVSTLRALRLPTARFELHAALRMQYEIGQARAAWRSDAATGWAIVAADTGRIVRALAPTENRYVLVRAGDVTVSFDEDGLSLARPGARPVTLAGWTIEDDSVSFDSTDPDSTEPASTDPATDDEIRFALSVLAASSRRVRIERAPLDRVFGPTLAPALEMAELAIHCGGIMHSRIGSALDLEAASAQRDR